MSTVNLSIEDRFAMIEARTSRTEARNAELERKMDNVNRNLVTAATIGGGVVGIFAGVAVVVSGGAAIPATAGAAKIAATYFGYSSVGGVSGAGTGWMVGEGLVRYGQGGQQ